MHPVMGTAASMHVSADATISILPNLSDFDDDFMMDMGLNGYVIDETASSSSGSHLEFDCTEDVLSEIDSTLYGDIKTEI